MPSSVSEEEAKRKARLARFAPYPKTDSVEEDKRKARALRYVLLQTNFFFPVISRLFNKYVITVCNTMVG